MTRQENMKRREEAAHDISYDQMKEWHEKISHAGNPEEKKDLRLAFKDTFGVNYSQQLAAEVLSGGVESAKEESGASPAREIETTRLADESEAEKIKAAEEDLLIETRNDLGKIAAEIEPEKMVAEKFKDFNITAEQVLAVKGFSELSPAQQALVYEGLKQMSLVDVKNRARETFDEEMKKEGFFGRMFKGLGKRYSIAKREKQEAGAIRTGGIELHQSHLEELTDMIGAMKIDATIEDGQVRIEYLEGRESFNAEQNEALANFNEIANRFGKLPQEWSLKTAGNRERKEYTYLSALYEERRQEALYALKAEGSESHALWAMNGADYKVKMMQFMSAHPDIDKEFSKIENQPALKKMISGEAAARGSYMAGGFVIRHTLAGLAGFGGLPVAAASFAAAPLAAAGIGAWRSHDRAKAKLIEKDIAGRKTDAAPKESGIEQSRKEVVASLRNLVPVEYALEPQKWYESVATAEEKERYDQLQQKYQMVMSGYQELDNRESDKTERHFYGAENLSRRLQVLTDKVRTAEGDEFRSALESLEARARFIEDKLGDGLVNFGAEGSLATKLDLVQALGEARLMLTMNAASLKRGKEDHDPGQDLQARFDRLFASKYLEFNKRLDESRRKYIRKEMIKGAGIGAAFAISGALLRDLAGQLGIVDNHAAVADTEKITKLAVNQETPVDAVSKNVGETVIQETTGRPHIEEIFYNTISNEGLGHSDSVWHSTKEIFIDNAEKFGYKGDISDSESLGKWAELQTAGAINNSGQITDKVFEGNIVLLEKDSAGNFFVKVETGSGAEPGVLEHVPLEKTEETIERTDIVEPIKPKPFAGLKMNAKHEDLLHKSASSDSLHHSDAVSHSEIGDNAEGLHDQGNIVTEDATVSHGNTETAHLESSSGSAVEQNVVHSNQPVTINEAIDSAEPDNSKTLEEVLASNQGDAVDKVLLEFAKEKGASAGTTVKELLDTYPGITAYMDENAGDSIYAHLYDLRHAAAGEQGKMLVDDLQEMKSELSDQAKVKFDKLAANGVFRVVKDQHDEPLLVFKLGAAQKEFAFSADGFKNLKEFVKSMIDHA